MSAHNEDFVHFDVCSDRLNSARRTLKLIKEFSGHPLTGPAFRFALVEYVVPYSRSDGTDKKRRYLPNDYIPKDLINLHLRLISSRNQVLAHADLSTLDPKLSYTDLDGQRLVSISQNNVTGLEELPNIDEIIILIERTLDNMYADRDNLKSSLDSES